MLVYSFVLVVTHSCCHNLIDSYFLQSIGIDGKKLEPESNVLLASIENMQYVVTLDVMHQVSSFVLEWLLDIVFWLHSVVDLFLL